MGEKLVVNPSFDICCPKCDEINTIKITEEIKCKKCETSFSGKKFGQIVSDGLANFALAGAIVLTADAYLHINRASVSTEYKMVKTCTDRYGTTIPVRNVCFCAVESMSGVIDAQMARFRDSEWLAEELDKRYRKCLN